MPGPVDRFILTPDIAEHAIKLKKAQQTYTQQGLDQVVGGPLGSSLSSNKQWVDSITNYKQNLPDLTTEQIQASCEYVTGIGNKYKNIIDSLGPDTDATHMPQDIVTQKNAQLQKEVLEITQERDSLQEDQEVAELRDTVLRSGNVAVSNHQIYLLGRPLRPASIPYLWALSVLFIGLGLLMFYMFFPYRMPPMDILLFDIGLFFRDPNVWIVLFSGASIGIFFLVLRITGII